MRDDIVGDRYDLGLSILLYPSGNGSEAGRHKRHPIAKDDQIMLFLTQLFADLEPIQRVDGIDTDLYVQILWRSA